MPINTLMSVQYNKCFRKIDIPYSLCWYDIQDATTLFDASGNPPTLFVCKITNKAVNSINVNNLISFKANGGYTFLQKGTYYNSVRNIAGATSEVGLRTELLTRNFNNGFASFFVYYSNGTPSGGGLWCKSKSGTNNSNPFVSTETSRYIGDGTTNNLIGISTFNCLSPSLILNIFYNEFDVNTMTYNEYVNSTNSLTATTSVYADVENYITVGVGTNNLYKNTVCLHECLFYDAPLSTVNRQIVEGWLATKYNLLAKLSIDHPYKSGYLGSNPLH